MARWRWLLTRSRTQPALAPLLAVAADLAARPPLEVVLAGGWEEAAPLRRELARHYLPDAVIVHLHPAAAAWWEQGAGRPRPA